MLRLPLLYGPFTDWNESAVTSLTPAIVKSADPASPPASMDAWATRYPTFTPDVAVVIRGMLEHHAKGATISGITQWSGDEPMTKFDIAQRIARALRVDAKLVAQRTPTDATPRPRDCHLDSGRLEALGIGRRTPFDSAIARLLAQISGRPGSVKIAARRSEAAEQRAMVFEPLRHQMPHVALHLPDAVHAEQRRAEQHLALLLDERPARRSR